MVDPTDRSFALQMNVRRGQATNAVGYDEVRRSHATQEALDPGLRRDDARMGAATRWTATPHDAARKTAA